MMYCRLRGRLNEAQSDDQMGFRTGIRIEDALGCAEILISCASEFNFPIWIASLDLQKAFDRVKHHAIFEALRHQGVLKPEIALLLDLYRDQTGKVNRSREFCINRGVKQGNVLSVFYLMWRLNINFRNGRIGLVRLAS